MNRARGARSGAFDHDRDRDASANVVPANGVSSLPDVRSLTDPRCAFRVKLQTVLISTGR